MPSLSLLATQAVHGLVYGMLLFLVASGLTLVFGMMRILNMAHASFYMLGAYIAASVALHSGSFVLALAVAPVVVGLLGALVERGLLRHVGARGHVAELLLTFGLFFMIGEAVLWIWGSFPLQMPPPPLLGGSVPLLGARYPVYRLFIFGFAALLCLALALVLLRTRVGIIIRSAVSDGDMVAALGINTSLVRMSVFGAGAALAALAGAIAVPFLQADPGMAASVLVDAFVVVVVGGFGSVLGAFVAALLLGTLQSFGVLFIPDFAIVFQFLLMAAVLVVRPQGLFGEAS
jgi:branched-chain amino acid transport system permease protein